MPFGLGLWEILILAGVLVLLFGAKGAPGMARRLGVGIREMKDAVTDMDPRTLLDAKDESAKAVPPRELEAAKPAAMADAEVVAAPAVATSEAEQPADEPPAS